MWIRHSLNKYFKTVSEMPRRMCVAERPRLPWDVATNLWWFLPPVASLLVKTLFTFPWKTLQKKQSVKVSAAAHGFPLLNQSIWPRPADGHVLMLLHVLQLHSTANYLISALFSYIRLSINSHDVRIKCGGEMCRGAHVSLRRARVGLYEKKTSALKLWITRIFFLPFFFFFARMDFHLAVFTAP